MAISGTNETETISQPQMAAYLDGLKATQDVRDIWRLAIDFFRSIGMMTISYHHVPPASAADYGNVIVSTEGFPEKWVEDYMNTRRFEFDPVPWLALEQTQPFRWSEVATLENLNPYQEQYLADVSSLGLGDGVSIPVYGPGGRNGCVGMAFESLQVDLRCMASLSQLQWLSQASHLKICSVLAESPQLGAKLSRREGEVLQWMARGKSNADISLITGISHNTVDTYVRRIFSKLDVSDRVTASVKGLGYGLIRAD